MQLTLEFYETAADTIPLLLVALAVERFRVDGGETDRAHFRTGLVAIATLILAECIALGVLASRRPTPWTDTVLLSALPLGLSFLAAAYANVLFSSFPEHRQRANKPRRLDLFLLALAVFSPVALMIWWYWPR